MVDAGENLRHEIRRVRGVGWKAGAVDKCGSALGQSVGDVVADSLRKPGRRHGAERGFFFERIAQIVAGREIDEFPDKSVVESFMHIDALNSPTALSRIEE